jgi:hypothetical protein
MGLSDLEEKSYNTFSGPDESFAATNENMPTTKDTVFSWIKQHKTWTFIITALICVLIYQFWKQVVMGNIITERRPYSPRQYPVRPDDQKAGKL